MDSITFRKKILNKIRTYLYLKSCSPGDSWLVEYACHWANRVITADVAVVAVHYFVDAVADVFVVEVPERFCVVDERAAVDAAVVVDLVFVVKSEFQYLQIDQKKTHRD